ncbi:MAG: hypothetical protein LAP13_13890 [Acidobacteriia bacterium]|nr:hypothetical protein [Terriglobia bacterium]
MKIKASPHDGVATSPESPAASLGASLSLGLACAAFFYPFAWTAQFLVSGLPALLRMTFWGDRLRNFHMSPFGVVAIASAADVTTKPTAGDPAGNLALTVLVVIVVAAALGIPGWKDHYLSSLGVALLGQAALAPIVLLMVYRQEVSTGNLIAAFLFFGVLTWGLMKLAGAIPGGTQVRLAFLAAAFVVPLAGLSLLQVLWQGFGFRRGWILLAMTPAILTCLVAALRPANRSEHKLLPPVRRTMAIGAALAVLLAAGATRGGKVLNNAFLHARQAANRAAMSALPPIPANSPYTKIFFQKGVNLTAQFPDTYDSKGARQMLDALAAYGVNAVALVPYGFERCGDPQVHLMGQGSWENDEGLRQLSRLAHARGMKVMLKPGVWVRGGYGGDLEFDSPADRARWFATYGVFLEHYARLATEIHADIFCVGGEFSKLSPFDAEWRKLIARVRGLYPGPLVYAANFGDEFEHLAFWDALDAIGLQEYYPLPDDLSTDALVRKVEAVQQKVQHPVIFTEAGFPSYEHPNREPWNDSRRGDLALDAQARCYEAVLRAFYNQPWFEGVYWWDVGTDGRGGLRDTSLTPWGKPAMQVIKHWYTAGGR